MSTQFCGHKTGFNPAGENDVTPNPLGPPATIFTGRPAVPAGPLKRYPGETADVGGGNRRLSRSKHGDGGDANGSTVFKGTTAFGNRDHGTGTGRSPPGMRGGDNRDFDRK